MLKNIIKKRSFLWAFPFIALTLGFITAQAQAITVDLTQTKAWNDGYLVDATITNDSSTAVTGWTLEFQLGSKIEKVARATFSGNDPYTIKSVSYSGNIGVGESEPFSFNGIGTFNASLVGNCVFNGVACTLTVNGQGGGASSVAASSTPASVAASSTPASIAPSSTPASVAASSTPSSSTPASSNATSSVPTQGNNLYTQIGTDKTWAQLLAEKAIPIGVNSTIGITGSKIDVNNALVNVGPNANNAIPQGIKIHTVGNSVISRSDFAKWSRWYQEDGNTQVFRLFKGETNVRNDRPYSARVEAFGADLQWKKGGPWHEFNARYTIIKPIKAAIFQAKDDIDQWSVMIDMRSNGDIALNRRRGDDVVVLTNMAGKSFDLKVRDNGLDYEVYFNGDFKGGGSFERNSGGSTVFRWGMYVGESPMGSDGLIFVTGANYK